MRTARTILAFLIILSVATLPVTSGAVGALKSADMTETAVMADMPDCCPGKINPCDKAMGDCQSMATCALKCFSFLGTSFSTVAIPLSLASLCHYSAASPLYSRLGSPPFRPPRV